MIITSLTHLLIIASLTHLLIIASLTHLFVDEKRLFVEELGILSKLRHPNIIQFFGFSVISEQQVCGSQIIKYLFIYIYIYIYIIELIVNVYLIVFQELIGSTYIITLL